MICLVVGTAPPGTFERLHERAPDIRCLPVASATPAEIGAAGMLFVWDFHWRSLDELLPMLPSLRWIHTASAGVDHVLVPGVIERGILVSNSAGVFEQPMAEYVLGLVLAHAKGFVATSQAQRERRWSYRETLPVAGATMVVVGVGRIGRAVGALARDAGLRVVGVRRQAGSDRLGLDDVVGVEDLRRAATGADYLVLTVALTPATHGLIDRATIGVLPPTAYVINVARAAVLDVDALVDALNAGRLAGATLDVFDDEPLPQDSPLWSTPGLLISPHMSADTVGWHERVVDVFVENARRFRVGAPLATAIDPGRGY